MIKMILEHPDDAEKKFMDVTNVDARFAGIVNSAARASYRSTAPIRVGNMITTTGAADIGPEQTCWVKLRGFTGKLSIRLL